MKADIKEAYSIVPIHPLLLRFRPFGLRSAHKIFSTIAHAIQWMLVQKGVS